LGAGLLKCAVLEHLINDLASSRPLTDEQVDAAVECLVDEQLAATTKAEFLSALARKGETTGEIAAFAKALRKKSVPVPIAPSTRAREILDVVGTGGDQLNTFNISTTVAILCSSAGIAVAKHGNRAITSKCGSADVLESLGVSVGLSPSEAAESLRDHHFAFFFAPNYHPAFKHIAPARKLCAERGQRTIFNILGPLLNPAHPTAQLIGVPRPELCEPLARVVQALGSRRAMVVCGSTPGGKLDELSTLGENQIAEFYQERGFTVSGLSLDPFPLQGATLADLTGGGREENAKIVCRLLRGEDHGPKRDAVLLNAAAALFVAGRTRSLIEGWDLAGRLIDDGAAMGKLTELGGH
jgi:anthranilate phosphoribosyltransferase